MSEDYNPNSIDAVLARMEARQVDGDQKITAFIQRTDERHTDIEKRIGALEKWRTYTAGVAAAVGVAAAYLKDLFAGKH